MPTILIVMIVLALVFDFLNGIHDSSNIVATMISSRAFSPRVALGVTARYVHSNLTGSFSSATIEAKPGNTAAVDIAVYYTKDFQNSNLSFGANISNIGAKLSYSNEDNNAMKIPPDTDSVKYFHRGLTQEDSKSRWILSPIEIKVSDDPEILKMRPPGITVCFDPEDEKQPLHYCKRAVDSQRALSQAPIGDPRLNFHWPKIIL